MGKWVPAIIGDVRPSGCLKLLHDDGSVLKKEADPNSVRLAMEQANQGYDKQAAFDSSLSDRAHVAMCSRPANCSKQANAEQSSGEAFGSKEAYDQRMEFLHGLSEKCTAQLKIHRGLSESVVDDQQLEFSHLEFRRSLEKAI